MPAQGYTPQTGDPPDDKKRTLGDILGAAYHGNLSAKVLNATFEDLLQSQGWIPPGGKPQNPLVLNQRDITDLKDAIVGKTAWTYGGPPSACCCCIG